MADNNLVQNSKDNILESYWESYCGGAENDPMDLTADELIYYSDKYSQYIEELNNRKYSKPRTLQDLYDEKKPGEVIAWFYVNGEIPDRSEVIDIAKEFVQWMVMWGITHDNHVHILNMQVLFDEPNEFDDPIPRCVVHEVWDYVDENGVIVMGQEKAMEMAGLELYDPSKEEDRKNHRARTWSKICRMKFLELLHDHGYEVRNKLLLTRNKRKKTGWWDT